MMDNNTPAARGRHTRKLRPERILGPALVAATLALLLTACGAGPRRAAEAPAPEAAAASTTAAYAIDSVVSLRGRVVLAHEVRAFIPEGDIYRLAAKSELPGAERFESWIFDEVIPSIRKHGAYMTSDTLDKMIASPDFGIKLLTELKTEREQRMALQAQNAALTAENELQRQTIADFEPARRYLDMILESNGSIATTQIAADYGMSAKVFNKLLRDAGIQHKVNGQWILYRKYMGKGYTDSRTIHFNHSDGRPDTKMQTYWTQKGRLFIYNTLKSFNGTVPMIEREFRA